MSTMPGDVVKESDRLSRALHSPALVFDQPADVLLETAWTPEQRRRVLEQWELDATRLQDSANENMTGGESSRLQEVRLALSKLDAG